jgi:hypothetical protein
VESIRAGGSKPAAPNEMVDRPSQPTDFYNKICHKRKLTVIVPSMQVLTQAGVQPAEARQPQRFAVWFANGADLSDRQRVAQIG